MVDPTLFSWWYAASVQRKVEPIGIIYEKAHKTSLDTFNCSYWCIRSYYEILPCLKWQQVYNSGDVNNFLSLLQLQWLATVASDYCGPWQFFCWSLFGCSRYYPSFWDYGTGTPYDIWYVRATGTGRGRWQYGSGAWCVPHPSSQLVPNPLCT